MANKAPTEKKVNAKLARLLELCRDYAFLNIGHDLLVWDLRTKMPASAGEVRSKALSLFAGLEYDHVSSDEFAELVEELSQSDVQSDLSSVAQAQVREAARLLYLVKRIPRELTKKMTEVHARAQETWVVAREKADYAIFQPHLQEIWELKREEARIVSQNLPPGGHIYDVLLDVFEPGMTVAVLDPVFADLGEFLAQMISAVRDLDRPIGLNTAEALRRCQGKSLFPKWKQKDFSMDMAKTLGFDFAKGRLDETVHPFCLGMPQDTRLTVRYDEDDPFNCIFSLIHETGHGLYHQGLPEELECTPAGTFRSLAMHESQSLLWEDLVGRSHGFWEFFLPKLNRVFPGVFDRVGVDDFVAYINRVTPDFIRVDADEVTYVPHIIIRYELEKSLLEGGLTVVDLPAAWNDAYEKYLGIRPRNDVEGVLQDVHWSHGSIGYFPTYALGKLIGAQLYATARQQLDNLDTAFARGDFSTLLQWTRQKVHQHASLKRTREILQEATGEELTAAPFKRHIAGKVATFYGVQV